MNKIIKQIFLFKGLLKIKINVILSHCEYAI